MPQPSPTSSNSGYLLWQLDRKSLGWKMLGIYDLLSDCEYDLIWYQANITGYIYLIGTAPWNRGKRSGETA